MTSTLLACAAGLLFSHAPLRAQDTAAVYRRPTIVKSNLLGPLSLFVERQLAARKSVQVSVQRIGFSFLGTTTKFFSLTLEMKFYLSKRPASESRPHPSGWYVSPYLKYRQVREEVGRIFSGTRSSAFSHRMLGGGVIAGKQVVAQKGFTLDAFLGGGYFPVSAHRTVYVANNGYVNTYPEAYRRDVRFGFCFGYAIAPKRVPVEIIR